MTTTRPEGSVRAAAEAPMFAPDPELVDHLEGDVPELERYREQVRRSADDARREWNETHAPRT